MKKYPIKLNIALTEDLYDFTKKRSYELTRSVSAYFRGLIIADRAEESSLALAKRVQSRSWETTGANGKSIIEIVKEEEEKIYNEELPRTLVNNPDQKHEKKND